MNIVNIGSDKTLAGGAGVGDAVSRHRKYGEYLNRLDIIVYSHRSDGLKEFKISNKVTGYPSNSSSKALFYFDALKIFASINRLHKVDLVVCQDPFVMGLIGLKLKRKYGVKLLINFHGDHWENPYWLQERAINRLFLLTSKFTVPRADAIRVVSRFIKDKLVRNGIAENNIRVIATPVHLDKFQNYDQNKVARLKSKFKHSLHIMYLGRLDPIKNLSMLIRAFAKVRMKNDQTALLIAGEGPEREPLEALAKKLNVDNDIYFTGAISQDDVSDYYHAVDIFTLVSYSEGMPKVLKEAAASGLPLIATKVSGSIDLIEEGVNGFLIDNNDEAALAQSLENLLRDNEKRKAMGVKSREIINRINADTTPELFRFWEDITKTV